MSETKKETCEWWEEYGVWFSDCGVAFEFTVDGPKENNFNFCYECGKMIDVKPTIDKPSVP